MGPTVSINLCCYNSERYLDENLQSIFSQTYQDWELIVINDGSTDSTEQIVHKYMENGWPIVYHFQVNAGLGRARNKAIELSKGEFIAIIDHDDVWLPTKLEKQMDLFANRPKVGLVYSDGVVFCLNKENQIYSRSNKYRYYRGNVLVPLALRDFVLCSSMIIRRRVLDKVGLFNIEFSQVEDYDLLLRIGDKYDFDYIAEPLVKYRIHKNNASKNTLRMKQETIQVFQKILKRHPTLSNVFSNNVIRIRLKGLGCELGQAYLLGGDWRSAYAWYGSWNEVLRILPNVVSLYILSFITPSQIEKIRSLRKLFVG